MKIKTGKQLAFVSGGNRGIGKATVIELTKKGYDVAFSFQKNQDQAIKLQEKLRAENRRVIAVEMENKDINSLDSAILNINTYFKKEISILINNAGMIHEHNFLDISSDQFNTMIQTNLYSAFYLSQKVIPNMIENNYGKIINISSIGGQWGGVKQVHYAIAKSGLISLTRSIAKMYAHKGINCNAISPGLIETDMIKSEMSTQEGKEKIKNIPAKRVGQPIEIASAISFLISDNASYINGQTLNVNGGMLFS